MLATAEELIEELKELKNSGKLIVIEGLKDKRALKNLGIENTYTLSRKPLFSVVEEIAEQEKEVVILTDFDKKGKELYNELSKHFEKLGVKVDNRFRLFLLKNTKLSHIEGLDTYVEKRKV